MKKIFCVLTILLVLMGCSNKSPVADKISVKDNVGIDFQSSLSSTYDYYVIIDSSNDLIANVFSPKSELLAEEISKAEENENEDKLEYLQDLKDEYLKWILNSSKYYTLTLSKNKVRDGESFTITFELTEKGKISAEKLGYEFTDTEFNYKIVDGVATLVD